MALISCPECGRKVSDKASACPDCGYPIAASNPSGITSIKIGDVIGVQNGGMTLALARASAKVILLDAYNQAELGSGKIGSVITIKLDKPKRVILRMAGIGGRTMFEGTIEPKKRYELVTIPSMLVKKWALNEIDVIDSGW